MTTSWQHHNNIVTTIQQHDNFEVQYHRRDHIAHFLLQFHSFYTSLTDSPPDSLIAPPQLFISSLQLFIAWHLHSFCWSFSLLVLLGSLLVFFARMPLPFNATIGDMLKRKGILWGSLLTVATFFLEGCPHPLSTMGIAIFPQNSRQVLSRRMPASAADQVS